MCIRRIDGREVLFLKGQKYTKMRAMSYRSYWYCVQKYCPAFVIFNHLKGGSLTMCKKHDHKVLLNKK